MAERLDRICADVPGGPVDQLRAWIAGMFGLIHDDRTRMHFSVIDSDEVRAAKGYRETREQAHADRERSLVEILRRGRDEGTFPLTDPEEDAIAISAVISRVMITQHYEDEEGVQRAQNRVLDFALRALGAATRDEFRAWLVSRILTWSLPLRHSAVVRQQSRGSRCVLHSDLPQFLDRGVRALYRGRAGHAR